MAETDLDNKILSGTQNFTRAALSRIMPMPVVDYTKYEIKDKIMKSVPPKVQH